MVVLFPGPTAVHAGLPAGQAAGAPPTVLRRPAVRAPRDGPGVGPGDAGRILYCLPSGTL